MAQLVDMNSLLAILRHEIGELRRIKRELNLIEHIPAIDNFSFVVFYSPYLKKEHVDSILKSMRESDVVAIADNHLLAILPGTDKEGAIHLFEGMKDFLSEEGYYIIVSYPEDGNSCEGLLESLKLYARSMGRSIPAL